MEPVPLTLEDRTILAIESETIAGHTCKVVICDGPEPGPDELRRRVAERVGREPMLRCSLSGPDSAPQWRPSESFDPRDHVAAEEPGALDDHGLRERVAQLFAERLDRSLPLWRIDILPMVGRRTALVWRVHHALADGTTAMRFARSLLWDDAPLPATAGAPRHGSDDERRRAHLARFVEREFGESLHRSPFDGRIGRRREIGFATASLPELHDAAQRLAGATLNDAVLSVLAGALRSWAEERHGSLAAVRVKVPVSLHSETEDAGNRDSFFTVPLPLNEPDPVQRLRQVQAATAARKAEHDAEAMDTLLRDLAEISPRLERFVRRVESSPRRFALNVSNVPGPRAPVSVLGSPVASMHSLAEIGRRHALRVAVVSLADRLNFGFCADPALVEGLETMAAATEAEAEALIAAKSPG